MSKSEITVGNVNNPDPQENWVSIHILQEGGDPGFDEALSYLTPTEALQVAAELIHCAHLARGGCGGDLPANIAANDFDAATIKAWIDLFPLASDYKHRNSSVMSEVLCRRFCTGKTESFSAIGRALNVAPYTISIVEHFGLRLLHNPCRREAIVNTRSIPPRLWGAIFGTSLPYPSRYPWQDQAVPPLASGVSEAPD